MPASSLATVLVGTVVMLVLAKAAGALFERFGQSAVIGELLVGVLLGNLRLLGTPIAEPLRTDPVVAVLAQVGVIILLFEVGLESNVGLMLRVGWSSLLVATVGVVASMGLGYAVARAFLAQAPFETHLFIAAALAATSVGVTARVYRDLRAVDRTESRIVLGAAVLDDVMGLVVLAVTAGLATAHAGGTAAGAGATLAIVGKAIAFLVVALVVGPRISPHLFRLASFLRVHGMLLVTALAVCFLFSWAAGALELAPIVGAFAAGVVLEEVHYRGRFGDQRLEDHIKPLSTVLVPLFFVRTGIDVDVRVFGSASALVLAALLAAAASGGKQICGWVALQRGIDRVAIGLGMVPRGEVALIAASAGRSVMIEGRPAVDDNVYSAIVAAVIVTILATPPLLKWRLGRSAA